MRSAVRPAMIPAVDDVWRQGTTGGRHQPAGGIVKRNVGVQGIRQSVDDDLLVAGCGFGRQHRDDEGVAPATPAAVAFIIAEPDEEGADESDHGKACQEREVDLEKETAAHDAARYPPLSWKRAKT